MDSIAKQPSDVDSFTRSGPITPGKPVLSFLHEWVVTVDHKKLGIMYILYALFFLVVGGVEAMLIRLQLAVPNNHLVGPQAFNQLFTMHGTTMIFLAAMPFIFGFANYLVPLMVGARDMAFPRLNAFGFWLTAFGGLLLYFSLIGGEGMTGAGSAPDVKVTAPTIGRWAYSSAALAASPRQ
jgi:cytochrome c oxidase subunit 1